MSNDPYIRSDETDGGHLPGSATPIIRRESADPDLPKTAREVATSIGTLITEVRKLNKRAYRNKRNITILAVFLVAIAALVVAVVGLGLRVFKTAECQGRINDTTRSAVVKHSEAFDKQTQALDTLASGVIDPVATSEQRRTKIIQFRNEMREAREQRDNNPLPVGNCS